MFAFRLYRPLMLARNLALWIGTILVLPAVIALLIKLILPRRKLLISGRAVVFLIATMVLAPGLMANVLLKDHWGRPRPIDVTQFGGTTSISSPGGIRAAIARRIALLCPAMWPALSGRLRRRRLAPPQWRALAYGAALALGIGMAAFRVMAGARISRRMSFSPACFTFLLIWLAYALIYRWPRTRSVG